MAAAQAVCTIAAVALGTTWRPSLAAADLALETETARPIGKGRWEVGSALEIQSSRDGREIAIPASVEVGITNRLELLVEPVFYTGIFPTDGTGVTSFGDSEVTLTYLLREETRCVPALAAALEVKFPTADAPLVGTGELDFAIYAIASRRIGEFDLHANVGYTFVGQPAGPHLSNIWNFALAAEWRLCPKVDLIAEVLGTTSSLSSGTGESSTTPEASGGEFVGTVGVRVHLSERASVFVDLSYDNADAVGARLGFSIKF